MVAVFWSRIGNGAAGGVDLHLVTGHVDGQVIMWDPSNDTLKPVLIVGRQKSSVKSLAVCEELGLLCCGHTSGKVNAGSRQPVMPCCGFRM